MKKIAFITPNLPHYRITFFEKLFKSFDADWLLFHGIKAKDDGRPKYEGKLNFNNVTYHSKTFKFGPYGLVYNKNFIGPIKAFKPNIIIVVGIPGEISYRQILKWAKKKDIKTILWVCGWESGEVKGIFQTIKRFFVKRFLNFADHHIAYGTWAKSYIQKVSGKSSNISIAYNGIEIDQYSHNYSNFEDLGIKLRNEHKIKDNDILFAYVGAINKSKRLDLLIHAFINLSKFKDNVYLWIIGDGPEKENLEKIIENNPYAKNIIFMGRIIDDVEKYFCAADCFVLPGAGGLAINEAMFWKTPCIVSFADGTEIDLVNQETGFFFERNILTSLTAKMKEFTNLSIESRDRMGEAGRKIIEEQSNINNMVNVFVDTIKTII